jgi:ribonuclease T
MSTDHRELPGDAREAAAAIGEAALPPMARRFRGFLPVVIDVECGGFNPETHALLELAAVLIEMEPQGRLVKGATHTYHVQPFPGAQLDPTALAVTGIDPFHPLRPALPEREVLRRLFRQVRHALRASGCRRAVLVGHNAAFDLSFLNAAIARNELKRSPFHPFSCFDTATLAGAALGQTVLAKAVTVSGMPWDASSAHTADYDAERTAELFCYVCNRLQESYQEADRRARELGWHEPPAGPAEETLEE